MERDPFHREHLVREWEQAWDHYRHLESTRGKYLGFFFTVLIASIGLTVGLLRDAHIHDLNVIVVGINLITFVVAIITIGLFTAILKMGFVLRRYAKIMRSVREYMGFSSSQSLPFDMEHAEGYPVGTMDGRLFSVQKSSEFVLFSTSVVLVFALCGFVVSPLFREAGPLWQTVVSGVVFVVALSYWLAVVTPLWRFYYQERKRADVMM